MTIDRPHCPPISRTDDRTWMQVIELFKQHGMAEPPFRLRDELVIALEWAWYGHALATKVRPLQWQYRDGQQFYTYFAEELGRAVYWINQQFGSDSFYFTTMTCLGVQLYDGDDLPSAKAAAQADYEQRIMSALCTSSSGGDSPPLMGIATAPKDGTWFIAYQNGEPFPCDWRVEEQDEGQSREGWFDFFNRSFEDPTHWLPVLGAAPEAK